MRAVIGSVSLRPVRSGGGIHVKNRGRVLRGLKLHQPGRESGRRVAQEL